MSTDFEYNFTSATGKKSIFVESIGMFGNFSGSDKEIIILPDGRIDLFFVQAEQGSFEVILMGLESGPKHRVITAGMYAYAVSFTPLGLEYILQLSIADMLNSARNLPHNFWDMETENFLNIETFQGYVNQKLNELMPEKIDQRKQKLFELIYSSKGEMGVAELAKRVGWSSRQINRYFNALLGVPLKTYCEILRFRSSLEHVALGKLFPELDFTDQSHFIKKIKKYAGALPKELSRNQNDRFVLLSVLKGG